MHDMHRALPEAVRCVSEMSILVCNISDTCVGKSCGVGGGRVDGPHVVPCIRAAHLG